MRPERVVFCGVKNDLDEVDGVLMGTTAAIFHLHFAVETSKIKGL